MAGPAFTRRPRFFVPSPTPPRLASLATPPSRGFPFDQFITKFSILNKVINH